MRQSGPITTPGAIKQPSPNSVEYIMALEKTGEILYIPYIVALEFSFNKSSIKKGKSQDINNYINSISTGFDKIKSIMSDVDKLGIREIESEFFDEFLVQVDDFK